MVMTNYPNGFSEGVLIKEIPAGANNPRKTIWVGNNATLLPGEKGASDSGSNGGTFLAPYSTLDYAIGQAKAGDYIYLRPGFSEAVTAAAGLDLDVAGITVVFLGNGANKAYISFTTDVGADMDIDAANITLINPKFVAGIDALTGPIDVNATDFTIINGEYHDATDINTTDCLIATSGATRLCINGWKYFKSNEGGTQKESHFQCDGVDDLILRNISVEGDFDTGIFETGTDECLRMAIENIFMKNTDAGNAPCFAMDSANSGWANNVHCRNANGTAVDNAADLNWSDTCLQYGTDGYGGDFIGTGASSGLEGKIDTIDGYHDVATADAATNAVMSDVVGNKEDAAINAVTTTKTLMAYIKGLLNEITVPSANNTDNAFINDVIGQKTDTAATGAVTTTDTLTAYIKQLVTDVLTVVGDTPYIADAALPADPTADSLAAFIASGGTALGQELPDSTSIVDIIGDFTGPHDGAAQDDNLKASLDLAHTDLDAILADTDMISGATLPAAPTANSLAAFIASGGTALGQELPDSQSLVDLLGDFTGPHDGTAQDDNIKASLDLAHTTLTAVPKCVEKSDGIVASNTTDDLFTIAGGPVRCKIVGLVTTLIGGAANMKLQHTTDSPAATVELNVGAVAINDDAVGTVYHNLGSTSVFTPSGELGVVLLDPVTVEETEFILAPGTVKAHSSAAQTGNIKWYMVYTPLSPSSTVTAAA